MSEEFKEVNYIMLFFEDLHNRYMKKDTENVKKVLQDYELFTVEINIKLEQMCDDYFGLKDTFDDTEW